MLVTNDAGEKVDVDYGEVGDVKSVNPDVVHSILETGAIPVVSPLQVMKLGVFSMSMLIQWLLKLPSQ